MTCRMVAALVLGLAMTLPAGAQEDPPKDPPKADAPEKDAPKGDKAQPKDRPKDEKRTEDDAASIRVDPQKQPQPISLRECIERALRQNLDIRVDAFNPRLNGADIIRARSVFDPVFFANTTLSGSKSDTTPRRTFEGEILLGVPRSSFSKTNTFSWDLGVRKTTVTGGTLELKYIGSRSRTATGGGPERIGPRLTPIDPRYSSSVELSFTQPVLRNAGPTVTRTDILIAENTRDASVFAFQQTVMRVVTDVEQRYYDLMLARENLRVAKTSLAQTEAGKARTQTLISGGIQAGLTLYQAESSVAAREEEVIVSINAVRDAEDALKNAIAPLDDVLLAKIELIPSEKLEAKTTISPLAAAIKSALRRRPELLSQRAGLNSRHLEVLRARNLLLPRLDVTGRLSFDGASHTYNESIEDVGEFRFFAWAIGLSLEIPLGNRSARASYTRARLVKAQAETSLKRSERNIVVEVRRSHRAITAARKRIRAANQGLVSSKKQLDAELVLFENGTSTPFEVNQKREDLIRAERTSIRAKIDLLQAASRLRQAEASTLDRLEKLGVLVDAQPAK